MKVSLNGLRSNLTNDLKKLKSAIEFEDMDDIVKYFNAAAQTSNVFNCCYSEEDESFKDMSDMSVDYIEIDDE